MTTERDPWKKLAAAARQAPPIEGGEQAPYGFSTHVVAAWKAQSIGGVNWERFGWGALVTAATVAALCVALNLEDLRSLRSDDLDLATVGPLERIL